jgi:hypothetical protein
MKIESGRGVAPSSAPRRAGAAAPASGFAPTGVEAPAPVAGASAVSSITPLDAIIALQSEEPAPQRRRRQTKRGQDALDALERLERGLLAGRAPAALKAELESLYFAAAPTGQEGLDEVLREIDIRLAVEIAKLDRMLGRT